jgi:hypothetical protein
MLAKVRVSKIASVRKAPKLATTLGHVHTRYEIRDTQAIYWLKPKGLKEKP